VILDAACWNGAQAAKASFRLMASPRIVAKGLGVKAEGEARQPRDVSKKPALLEPIRTVYCEKHPSEIRGPSMLGIKPGHFANSLRLA
jgi:hypothetical protein